MQSISSELIDRKEVISNVKLFWQRPTVSSPGSSGNSSPDSRWHDTKESRMMKSCYDIGNLVLTCCNTKLVIDRLTGLPCLISKDGVNILAGGDILDTAYAPCRVQLHRAPIDNDRIGYSSRWEALGIDKQMMYVPNRSVSESSDGSDSFSGIVSTEFCTYHRLPRLADGSEGVEVKWTMKPSHITMWKIEYIKLIASFYDSDEHTHSEVAVQTHEEEVFVYHLCSIHQLAWETTLVDATNKSAVIKIWKLNLNMCTTTREASRAPPMLSPSDSNNKENNIENHGDKYPVAWCITYYMSITGKVTMNVSCDVQELSFVPIPRVGIQLQLDPKIKGVTWSGCGPHECYNDRKYSTVNAVHQASIDSLHVPYIRPSENGNRCEVDWLQLSSEFNDYTTIISDCNNKKLFDGSLTNSFNTVHSLPSSSSTSSSSKSYDTANQEDESKDEINQTDFMSDDEEEVDDRVSCRIYSSKLFNFSAQYYTTEDLMQIANSKDLETFRRKFISLNIDGHLMGLGGDDSWTACVHEEYLLKHKQMYTFDLAIDFI